MSANPSLSAWAPVRAVPWSAPACFFLHVIGLPPYTIEVGFPRFPVQTISWRIAFSRLQPFRYVQELVPIFEFLLPKPARLSSKSTVIKVIPGNRGL